MKVYSINNNEDNTFNLLNYDSNKVEKQTHVKFLKALKKKLNLGETKLSEGQDHLIKEALKTIKTESSASHPLIYRLQSILNPASAAFQIRRLSNQILKKLPADEAGLGIENESYASTPTSRKVSTKSYLNYRGDDSAVLEQQHGVDTDKPEPDDDDSTPLGVLQKFYERQGSISKKEHEEVKNAFDSACLLFIFATGIKPSKSLIEDEFEPRKYSEALDHIIKSCQYHSSKTYVKFLTPEKLTGKDKAAALYVKRFCDEAKVFADSYQKKRREELGLD